MNLPDLLHSPFANARSAADKHPNAGSEAVDSRARNDVASTEMKVSGFSRSEVSVSINLSQTSRYLSSRHNEAPAADSKIETGKIAPADELSKKSADTILGFIERHLQSKRADGATSEELSNTLAAALKGFEQGYSGAIDSLGGLGSLPNNVADGIAETGSLVRAGIADLKKEFTTDASPQNETVAGANRGDNNEAASAPQYTSQRKVSGFSEVQTVAASYAESYRRHETVDLQLKTNDGDIVTLSFSAGHSAELKAGFSSDQFSTFYAAQQNSSSSSSFSLSVQGELDDGELAALNELFSDVGSLSSEFFEGDFQTAYAMALDFELDYSEFSQFSLDLALTTHTEVVGNAVAGQSSDSPAGGAFDAFDLPEINNQLFDNLTKMIDQMANLLEKAEKFGDPQQLLTDLLANQLAQKNLSGQQSLSALSEIS